MNILYVCTWNIFRSMSAEYLSKRYISDNDLHDILFSSAGTIADFQEPYPMTVERLQNYGCDCSQHQQRRITTELLAEQDLIICMAQHHRESVKDLGFESILFNEIAYDKTEDLLDDGEYMQINGPDLDLDSYVTTIVDYIHDAIPFVIKSIRNE